MANAALASNGPHGNITTDRQDVRPDPRYGDITQSAAPAPKRDDYSVGPDGRAVYCKPRSGIMFK